MRKFWKIVKVVGVIVIVIVIVDLATVIFFSFYRPVIQKADAVVILGAAINTPALYNRTLEGLRIYKEGDAPVLVLSGGVDYPKSISEAVYMQNVILQNVSVVPPMLLDNDAHSTFENLQNTQNLIGPGKSIIIVSDDFHLARAVLTAKRLGFTKIYWTSPKPTYYKNPELIFYYLREVVAMAAYVPKFVMGR